MLKFSKFHKIMYFIEFSLCLIYNKNLSLRGVQYIHRIPELHNLYTSTLFADHNPNNPPTLEDIATFYLCQFYQPGQKAKWSFHLNHNTLLFLHAMKSRTRHFIAL